jgi:RNA polymerase sigma factor (sigma-70 family)
MSPLTIRRYRAERLLRQEFEQLRAQVIANVRARLRAGGVTLDAGDLESCYAIAWQGLYAVLLEGREISSPAAWLTVVAHRRAIDEHRSRTSALCHPDDHQGDPRAVAQPDHPANHRSACERDLAAELYERTQLRQLFEGLRGRLSAREREAATLCYLQGLSRADAAARMGVSESRMRKLMDGAGAGEQGVAGKVGALVATISDGRWCEDQASLMRALAYGILDPDGQRYQLALAHHDDCPACRAYVRSLRGLAVVLPPVLLPWGLGASVLARAGTHAAGGIGASAGASGGAGAAGGAGSAGGAASLSGAVGAGGAASGGWLVAGGTFAGKLAAGCLLALGVGAGCLALSAGAGHSRVLAHRHRAARVARVSHSALASDVPLAGYRLAAAPTQTRAADTGTTSGTPAPAAKASREFGPEQALASGASRSFSPASVRALTARSASTSPQAAGEGSGSARGFAGSGGQSGVQSSTADGAKAEREFAPG